MSLAGASQVFSQSGVGGFNAAEAEARRNRQLGVRVTMLRGVLPELDDSAVLYRLASLPVDDDTLVNEALKMTEKQRLERSIADLRGLNPRRQRDTWATMDPTRRELLTSLGYTPARVEGGFKIPGVHWTLPTLGGPGRFVASELRDIRESGEDTIGLGLAVVNRPYEMVSQAGYQVHRIDQAELDPETGLLPERHGLARTLREGVEDAAGLVGMRQQAEWVSGTGQDKTRRQVFNEAAQVSWEKDRQAGYGGTLEEWLANPDATDRRKQFRQAAIASQAEADKGGVVQDLWQTTWHGNVAERRFDLEYRLRARALLDYDPEMYGLAVKVASGQDPVAVVQSAKTMEEDMALRKLFDKAYAKPEFQDAVEELRLGTFSVGRHFARNAGLRPDTDRWSAYNLVSGGGDFAANLILDPLNLGGEGITVARKMVMGVETKEAVQNLSDLAKLGRTMEPAEAVDEIVTRRAVSTPEVKADLGWSGRTTPSGPSWQAARRLLDENGPAIAQAEEAASKTEGWLAEDTPVLLRKLDELDVQNAHKLTLNPGREREAIELAGRVKHILKTQLRARGAMTLDDAVDRLASAFNREIFNSGLVDEALTAAADDLAAEAGIIQPGKAAEKVAGTKRVLLNAQARYARKVDRTLQRVAETWREIPPVDFEDGLTYEEAIRKGPVGYRKSLLDLENELPYLKEMWSDLAKWENLRKAKGERGVESADDLWDFFTDDAGFAALKQGRAGRTWKGMTLLPADTWANKVRALSRTTASRVGNSLLELERGAKLTEKGERSALQFFIAHGLASPLTIPVKVGGSLILKQPASDLGERILLTGPGAADQFRRMLGVGIWTGMSRETRARMYDMFVKGIQPKLGDEVFDVARLEASRRMVAFAALREMFEHSGLTAENSELVDDALRNSEFQRYASSGRDVIEDGEGGMRVAIRPSAQHASAVYMPNMMEVLRQKNRLGAMGKVYNASIGNRWLDVVMAQAWRPFVIMRPGFIFRTGIQEWAHWIVRQNPLVPISARAAIHYGREPEERWLARAAKAIGRREGGSSKAARFTGGAISAVDRVAYWTAGQLARPIAGQTEDYLRTRELLLRQPWVQAALGGHISAGGHLVHAASGGAVEEVKGPGGSRFLTYKIRPAKRSWKSIDRQLEAEPFMEAITKAWDEQMSDVLGAAPRRVLGGWLDETLERQLADHLEGSRWMRGGEVVGSGKEPVPPVAPGKTRLWRVDFVDEHGQWHQGASEAMADFAGGRGRFSPEDLAAKQAPFEEDLGLAVQDLAIGTDEGRDLYVRVMSILAEEGVGGDPMDALGVLMRQQAFLGLEPDVAEDFLERLTARLSGPDNLVPPRMHTGDGSQFRGRWFHRDHPDADAKQALAEQVAYVRGHHPDADVRLSYVDADPLDLLIPPNDDGLSIFARMSMDQGYEALLPRHIADTATKVETIGGHQTTIGMAGRGGPVLPDEGYMYLDGGQVQRAAGGHGAAVNLKRAFQNLNAQDRDLIRRALYDTATPTRRHEALLERFAEHIADGELTKAERLRARLEEGPRNLSETSRARLDEIVGNFKPGESQIDRDLVDVWSALRDAPDQVQALIVGDAPILSPWRDAVMPADGAFRRQAENRVQLEAAVDVLTADFPAMRAWARDIVLDKGMDAIPILERAGIHVDVDFANKVARFSEGEALSPQGVRATQRIAATLGADVEMTPEGLRALKPRVEAEKERIGQEFVERIEATRDTHQWQYGDWDEQAYVDLDHDDVPGFFWDGEDVVPRKLDSDGTTSTDDMIAFLSETIPEVVRLRNERMRFSPEARVRGYLDDVEVLERFRRATSEDERALFAMGGMFGDDAGERLTKQAWVYQQWLRAFDPDFDETMLREDWADDLTRGFRTRVARDLPPMSGTSADGLLTMLEDGIDWRLKLDLNDLRARHDDLYLDDPENLILKGRQTRERPASRAAFEQEALKDNLRAAYRRELQSSKAQKWVATNERVLSVDGRPVVEPPKEGMLRYWVPVYDSGSDYALPVPLNTNGEIPALAHPVRSPSSAAAGGWRAYQVAFIDQDEAAATMAEHLATHGQGIADFRLVPIDVPDPAIRGAQRGLPRARRAGEPGGLTKNQEPLAEGEAPRRGPLRSLPPQKGVYAPRDLVGAEVLPAPPIRALKEDELVDILSRSGSSLGEDWRIGKDGKAAIRGKRIAATHEEALDRWADLLAEEDLYLHGGKPLRQVVAAFDHLGEVPVDMFQKMAWDDLPRSVKAHDVHTQVPNNMFTQVKDSGFNRIGHAIDAIIRHPMFLDAYLRVSRDFDQTLRPLFAEAAKVDEVALRNGLRGPAVQAWYRNLPEEVINPVGRRADWTDADVLAIMGRAADDDVLARMGRAGKQVHVSLMEMDVAERTELLNRLHQAEVVERFLTEAAVERATRDVVPFIDDSRQKSQFATVGRNIAPFWYAEEQFLSRWAKTIAYEPWKLRRGALYVHGAKEIGVMDDKGNVTLPASPFLTPLLAQGTGVALTGGKVGLPADVPLSVNATSIMGVPFTENLPTGPLVTISANVIGRLFPELDPATDELAGFGADQAAWESLMPAWARRIVGGVLQTGSAKREIATASIASAQALAAEAERLRLEADETEDDAERQRLLRRADQLAPPPDASAAEVQEWIDNVREGARAMLVVRGLYQTTSPGRMNLEVDKEGLNQEVVDRMRTTSSVEEAMMGFLADHPEATAYTVFSTKVDSKAPLRDLSQRAVDWMGANSDTLRNYRLGAAWMVPQDGFGKGTNAAGRRAYEIELATGLRRRMDMQEWSTAWQFAEAAPAYFEAREQYEKALETAAGPQNLGKRQLLKDMWRDWSTTYKLQHPVFAEELSSTKREENATKTLFEVRQLLYAEQPFEMPSHAPAMRELIDGYDSYNNALLHFRDDRSKAGMAKRDALKAAFARWGKDWSTEHPEIRAFWESIIRYLARLEDPEEE